MGRVYEALRRAAEQNGARDETKNGRAPRAGEEKGIAPASDSNGNGAHAEANAKARSAVAAVEEPARASAAADEPELFLRTSRHFQPPDAAQRTAPTGHTGTPVGSALPDGAAPRDAGATLGAAGSARTPEFVSVDISAARVEPHLVAITQPRSGHAERYRSLRTRVLHAGERRKMQAFVVTSAGVMEGKTLTAINLSWLLAQTDGVSALLIDGDLRNPCAANYLGLDAPAGLSEVLAGEATLAESVVRLEPAGLHLLPGGSARDDVAELLSGPKFSAVLREARRMFDYIIIDAPPLGIFTDATLLISRADSALIVARANKTRYGSLEKLLEPLPRERLLGVILNGSDEQLNEQNYYYRRYTSRRDVEVAEDLKRGARGE
jgi:capsular exopolysaccharide synthesis family protein